VRGGLLHLPDGRRPLDRVSLRFDDEFVTEMRGINGDAQMVNLVPFAWHGFPPDFTDEQICGNILLAMPFGFGWPFLVGRGIRRIAIAGVVFALAIELVQLLIDLGYGFGYRTVDVTDVLLYVAGVAAGYLVFRVASAIYRRILGNDHADQGIWGHAHRVLVG
jgi:glycopeptide antibiotics resistance protein